MPDFDWLEPSVARELTVVEEALSLLRHTFDGLPSSLPGEELGLPLVFDFENQDGPDFEARALDTYLTRCFGALESIVIPETSPRLTGLLEQLWFSAETIAESSSDIGGLRISCVDHLSTSGQLWIMLTPSPSPAPVPPLPFPQPNNVLPVTSQPVAQPSMRTSKQQKITAFKRLTREEMAEREQAEAEERRCRREREARIVEEMKQKKLRALRDAANRRQRELRRKVKLQEIANGKRRADGTLVKQTVNEALEDRSDTTHFKSAKAVARITLSHHYTCRTKAATAVKRHKTNWAHPAVFCHLDGAAKVVGFQSPTAIVTRVQKHNDAGMFTHLRADVLGKYIEEDEFGNKTWSPAYLERVERERAKAGPGRSQLIEKYPSVFKPATPPNEVKVKSIPRLHSVASSQHALAET
ncbi:hypothetical protein AURDEDRAFT_177924 [Auricularia subglabra TFB-10046 SS5]|uniref:Uncharacterized protein n=1 Tax=Auricularia subglabra (strain TFB-10046 / SS5) TaxID=717982 RepID=J0WMF3_AURST|nr:hypothetical protein AURDEDRAFT_177924 [Auricularia subglabra TFB-10046 SS5]